MTYWMDRRVLVTGASGLLGSWLVRDLVRRGTFVLALVRDRVWQSALLSSGLSEKIDIIHGDLSDASLVERALNEYDAETVFHLGAQALVGVANRNPLSTFESNVRGTWILLECVRRCRTVKQVIVASSDKAYGDQAALPYTEEMPLRGLYPYDASKSCADLIATSYAKTFGVPVSITRCGNIIGGGDLNYSRLVPGTIRSVLRGEAPIIRSDGRYVRDYIYVEDVVAGYLQLAEAMSREDLRGRAFNFSCEDPKSVAEVVDRILTLMERTDLKPRVLNEATHEIRQQYLSSRLARETFGWEPRYPFEEGLRETIAWYRRHLAPGRA